MTPTNPLEISDANCLPSQEDLNEIASEAKRRIWTEHRVGGSTHTSTTPCLRCGERIVDCPPVAGSIFIRQEEGMRVVSTARPRTRFLTSCYPLVLAAN